MFRITLIFSLLFFHGCTHRQATTSQVPANSVNPINSNLQARLKANIYRTKEITNSGTDWAQPPEYVSHISFEQLTATEKQTYLILEQLFVTGWIQCNEKEFLWEDDKNSKFYFFEIMNYKPRVEINTLPPDSNPSIEWKGNIRIGIFNALARDVIPNQKYTYLSEYPEQSLPNFSSAYYYKNAYLKNGKLYTNKDQEIKTTPRQRNCHFINEIMKTTGN